ncbi:hypothetical protein CK203_041733 [Vitis vinifera]|uniref:Uncharacterized protein n=1 Tax=Vitis vinifera TaxID=29760 RepID=A0A438HD13_VITVI|nr:hypothetical protein CK203_041733 [Vitis vinifera]
MRNHALLGKWLWRFPKEISSLWHEGLYEEGAGKLDAHCASTTGEPNAHRERARRAPRVHYGRARHASCVHQMGIACAPDLGGADEG